MNDFHLPGGTIKLPAFLPDATRGFVRAVGSEDLEQCNIQGLVMNTFHLMQAPGSSTIQALGGLHKMSGWSRPIMTDSGGFQIYSLIHQNPKLGSISNKGANFHLDEGKAARKLNLTPEKSIQLQLAYGSDVVVCLDDCTHVDAPFTDQEAAVRRTIDWARRSRPEFDRITGEKHLAEAQKPLIFAVIQGGGYPELRKRCADALLEIGFDGYGFGGWPLDSQGNLLLDMLAYTRELVPPEYPMHALGVAHPSNVVECIRLGYQLCDGAMPTRDARHARLYAFQVNPSAWQSRLAGNWFTFVYSLDDKYIKADQPVSPYCDCILCTRYSLGYLRHLFKSDDSLALRLATIHNLRFMSQMMENLGRQDESEIRLGG